MRYIISRRVWVDENTDKILGNLCGIGKRFISRENLIGAIIYEWIKSGGVTKVGNIRYDDDFSKSRFIYFDVAEDLWSSFLYCCSSNGLNINIGFKIAVNYFADLVINDSINLMEYILSIKDNF